MTYNDIVENWWLLDGYRWSVGGELIVAVAWVVNQWLVDD